MCIAGHLQIPIKYAIFFSLYSIYTIVGYFRNQCVCWFPSISVANHGCNDKWVQLWLKCWLIFLFNKWEVEVNKEDERTLPIHWYFEHFFAELVMEEYLFNVLCYPQCSSYKHCTFWIQSALMFLSITLWKYRQSTNTVLICSTCWLPWSTCSLHGWSVTWPGIESGRDPQQHITQTQWT